MNTKLTLSLEKELIEQAKKFAREQNRSLSEIVANYFKALTRENTLTSSEKEEELSPRLKSLKGSFKLPPDFDWKKDKQDRLVKKYLK